MKPRSGFQHSVDLTSRVDLLDGVLCKQKLEIIRNDFLSKEGSGLMISVAKQSDEMRELPFLNKAVALLTGGDKCEEVKLRCRAKQIIDAVERSWVPLWKHIGAKNNAYYRTDGQWDPLEVDGLHLQTFIFKQVVSAVLHADNAAPILEELGHDNSSSDSEDEDQP